MYILGASVQFGPATLSLTLISRGICGIAEGLIGTAHHSMLARLASANSQKDLFMLYTLVESMGAALGPITSSTLLLSVAPLVPSLPQGAVPVLCMFVIHMLVFFLACLMPSTCEIEEVAGCSDELDEENAAETQAAAKGSQAHQRAQQILAVALVFLMYSIISGIESATSLVLELRYQWHVVNIGYAVSLCIMMFLPFYFIFQIFDGLLEQSTLMRLSLGGMALITLLLLPQTCSLLVQSWSNHCAWLIVLSDSLVYPLAALICGLSEGHAYDGALSRNETDQISRWMMVAGAVSYMGIPPLVRLLFDMGGLACFAIFQVSISVLAGLLNECRLSLATPAK